jgi:lipid-binding SYLF domain-containing protein
MKSNVVVSAVALALLSASAICVADDKQEEQAKIRSGVSETLQDLYKLQPGAQGAIQKAAGYAVFKNFGTNLLVVSTGSGKGIATNNKTKQDTFMKMISGGVGLGVGVKDFRAIFVFQTEKAFNEFLDSGWSGSAQADAAAKKGESGGALSGAIEVAPDVYVYQITKNGLALQLTLQGTKYYKDDDLNK